MDEPIPPEWEKLLEAKSLREILKVEPPTDLPDEQRPAFNRAKFAWFDARHAKLLSTARGSNIDEQRGRISGLLAARAEQLSKSPPMKEAREIAEPPPVKETPWAEQPVRLPRPRVVAPPMITPKGSSDELLERQLATASG